MPSALNDQWVVTDEDNVLLDQRCDKPLCTCVTNSRQTERSPPPDIKKPTRPMWLMGTQAAKFFFCPQQCARVISAPHTAFSSQELYSLDQRKLLSWLIMQLPQVYILRKKQVWLQYSQWLAHGCIHSFVFPTHLTPLSHRPSALAGLAHCNGCHWDLSQR